MRAWIACAVVLTLAAPVSIAGEPKLADLAWLAGAWTGEQQGAVMEEVWMSPRGSVMAGMHRDIAPGGRTEFEYLRIEVTDSGLVYVASPGGGPTTRFPLISAEEHKAVFENLQHDHPQRIQYWLDSAGNLHARIESSRDGQTKSNEWVWKPAKP